MAERVVICPATEADVESMEVVLRAHDDPPAGAPPFPDGAYHPYLRHLLARGTVSVAMAGEAMIGFGASVDTGRAVHLADLFVLPDVMGEGVGRRNGVVGACVMGPNPALRALIVDYGFRIVDRDTFMSTDPSLLDPRGIYDTGVP